MFNQRYPNIQTRELLLIEVLIYLIFKFLTYLFTHDNWMWKDNNICITYSLYKQNYWPFSLIVHLPFLTSAGTGGCNNITIPHLLLHSCQIPHTQGPLATIYFVYLYTVNVFWINKIEKSVNMEKEINNRLKKKIMDMVCVNLRINLWQDYLNFQTCIYLPCTIPF